MKRHDAKVYDAAMAIKHRDNIIEMIEREDELAAAAAAEVDLCRDGAEICHSPSDQILSRAIRHWN